MDWSPDSSLRGEPDVSAIVCCMLAGRGRCLDECGHCGSTTVLVSFDCTASSCEVFGGRVSCTHFRQGEMRWVEMSWDEMSWDEMRWDEMRWGETRWNEMKRDEVRWDGLRWVEMLCCIAGLVSCIRGTRRRRVFTICSAVNAGSIITAKSLSQTTRSTYAANSPSSRSVWSAALASNTGLSEKSEGGGEWERTWGSSYVPVTKFCEFLSRNIMCLKNVDFLTTNGISNKMQYSTIQYTVERRKELI